MRIIEAILCGRFRNGEVRALLAHALARVPLKVLKARVAAAATVNVSPKLRAVFAPVLCLRATEDRIVPAAAHRKLIEGIASAHQAELVAPHFLLQTVPRRAAEIVSEFMEVAGRST